MADRLNQPKERIRIHLVTGGKYDKISAMFYILQDTLMKEVLYPPRDLENSFIYQLECRRKSHSSSHTYESEESDLKISGGRSSKSSKPRGGTYTSRYFDHEANNKSKLSGSRSERESRNIADIRRRIGDGEHDDIESKAARRNNFKINPLISKTEKESSKARSTISDKSSIPHSTTFNVSEPPFRSYKSNRPARETKEPATRKTGATVPRHPGDFLSHPEENDYLEITESQSDFSSSVNMNNSNEVKVLNEKFYNMCQITPQNIKDNPYNVEHGSFNRQRNAVTPNMNQLQQRKFVPGLLNMKQYSADNFKQQRKYDLRPSTTQSLMKPASADAVSNTVSSEQSPSNVSRNAKLNQQLRQRSMVIRRTNAASDISESSNKIPINKFQYGPTAAYIQNPIYGMSTKKSSNGSRKSYNVNLNPQ
ncbi:hormonally up-regulated neu tumor-associated kinase [Trichonephila inaurata madagascariensis]|uniref:Hormonally up-regulated neu tumor-associated kinase n=2 Tax=Trichonephila inaurata madagascariensis TaxID=2747483 RepID=A0A8X6JUV6_9ARAC|nr:hormonally up-regulated neu tumor-associated kinase [Trichonephila inaurata madagascariensis]